MRMKSRVSGDGVLSIVAKSSQRQAAVWMSQSGNRVGPGYHHTEQARSRKHWSVTGFSSPTW